jgi:hypothetical protein
VERGTWNKAKQIARKKQRKTKRGGGGQEHKLSQPHYQKNKEKRK